MRGSHGWLHVLLACAVAAGLGCGTEGPAGKDGTSGTNGTNGLACWDLDGDGACTLPAEDKTGDGRCDIQDCQGLKGQDGLNGTDGAKGTDGAPGADGKDGATGPAGTACWDLNANGTCDEADEDGNDDGQCSALDCQGAKGSTGATGPQGDKGDPGDTGAAGADGRSTGILSVTVFAADGTTALAGAQVVTDPATTTLATDAGGKATANPIAIGAYTVIVTAAGYDKATFGPVGVAATDTPTAVTFRLNATPVVDQPPTVTLPSLPVALGYGATITLGQGGIGAPTAVDPEGGSLTYAWTQTGGAPATITGADTLTPTITLPTIDQAFLVKLPGQSSPTNLLPTRFGLVGIWPDVAGTITLSLVVTDPSGKATTKTLGVNAASTTTGLRAIPVGVRQYVRSARTSGWAWTLSAPAGSAATLAPATDPVAAFVPDKPGRYTIANGTETMDVFAGTWAGYSDEACGTCHGAGGSTDMSGYWRTGHASIFTVNVNGGTEGAAQYHYSASCVKCHSVGYDAAPTAVNNGWDDVAAAQNPAYKVPAAYDPEGWSKVPSAVRQLSNIQCENCHGPQAGTTQHTKALTEGFRAARITLDDSVCTSCHQSGTHHNKPSLWFLSGHANQAAAVAEGPNNHCGRCHSAQGFLAYLDQIEKLDDAYPKLLDLADTSGPTCARDLDCQGFAAPDAAFNSFKCLAGKCARLLDAAGLAALGLDAQNAQPITCQACHDPHNADNKGQVRVSGKTLMANGYEAVGAGTGALCMTCHNSRNGAHGDAYTMVPGYSAPHVAAQADVYLGQNAYFVQGTHLSRHAAIEDTCAGCHVNRSPEGLLAINEAYASNHTFRTDASICRDCHSKGVNGEAQQALFESLLEELGAAIGDAAMAKIGAEVAANTGFTATAWDPAQDKYSAAIQVTQVPTGASLYEIHGQIGFVLRLATPIPSIAIPNGTPMTDVTQIHVRSGDLKDFAGAAALVASTDRIIQAAWNYFLLEADGSRSLHNPSFVFEVLDATLAALAP